MRCGHVDLHLRKSAYPGLPHKKKGQKVQEGDYPISTLLLCDSTWSTASSPGVPNRKDLLELVGKRGTKMITVIEHLL